MKAFKLLALTVSVFAISSIDVAHAQEEDAEEEIGGRGAVEEIVVTGSRIKRRDFNSPSPITTIDRDAIAASNEATLEGLLNEMPQVTPHFGRGSNNPGSGKSHINLRGLGPGRTLIMLNARRFAPSGVGNNVDINNIPQALIDRVEVITGGASTVYGSDALAGVVNFVTRDDFDGFNVEASYSVTEEGDAAATDVNLAWGKNFGGGRGNVTLFGGYYEREELFAGDREFTRYAWQERWDDGSLVLGGSSGTPEGAIFFPQYDLGSGPNPITFNPDGTPRVWTDPDDRYNWQPVNYLQVPLERYSAGVFANYELDSGFEVYLESTYADNDGKQELASVPAFGFFSFTSDNPIYAPETRAMLIDGYEVAPGVAAAFLGRRMVEIGPRHIDTENDFWRTAVGVRGTLSGSWDIDAWATYTMSDEEEHLLNDVFFSRVEQGLNVDPVTGQCLDTSNGCQPVDLFGPGRMSPEAADFLRVPPFVNITERSQKLAAVVVTGTLFDGWAGPIDIAAGIEWRSDEVDFEADPALFTENTLGYNGSAPVSGTESVTEVYFEGILPLYHQAGGVGHIDLEFGGRYSEYDLAGGVWTYKAGMTWQVSEALRFRGMFQHSVRAPNNFELFQQQFDEIWVAVFEASDDPCSASQDPAGNGLVNKCLAQGLDIGQIGVFEATPALPVTFVQGGNPDLEPEEADTITAGLVVSPMSLPNWEFALDYFDLELDGGIGEIDAYGICFDINNDNDIFCDKIQRGPSGDIATVEELQQNRGLFNTSGVDTQVRFSGDMPQWLGGERGLQLDFNLVWTHILSLESQENPVTSNADCRGFFGAPCLEFAGITAENRVSASIGVSTDRLRVTLNTQWVDGTDNWGKVDYKYVGGPPAILAIPSIGSQYYADLNISYHFTDGLTAALGVTNIFDREPPLLANNGWGNNTEDGLYDVFGRAYRVSFAYRFGN